MTVKQELSRGRFRTWVRHFLMVLSLDSSHAYRP